MKSNTQRGTNRPRPPKATLASATSKTKKPTPARKTSNVAKAENANQADTTASSDKSQFDRSAKGGGREKKSRLRPGKKIETGVVLNTRNGSPDGPATGHRWTFLTNHAHVLILLSQDNTLVLKNVAKQVRITERAVQRIVADLEEEGYIQREKIGRQNVYRIRLDIPLRHPIESHRKIGDLIDLGSTKQVPR